MLVPNLYGLIEVAQKRVQPEGELIQNTTKSVPDKNSKRTGRCIAHCIVLPEEADKREVSQHLVKTVAAKVSRNRVGVSLVVVHLEM